MTEPCKFPSLSSCQKRFLRVHEDADFAVDPVVGLSSPCPMLSHRRTFPERNACGRRSKTKSELSKFSSFASLSCGDTLLFPEDPIRIREIALGMKN